MELPLQNPNELQLDWVESTLPLTSDLHLSCTVYSHLVRAVAPEF